MTYENTLDIEFTHKGGNYGVTADCLVELSKRDIGPEGHREHLWRYVSDSVSLTNISIANLDTGEELGGRMECPSDILDSAEEALTEKAEEMAEQAYEDE